jgi:glycosyltransferase involved in cell wall biosynthesis
VRRARAALGLAPDDLVVGCVAALRPEKRHELLLGAAARLVPRHPRLRVVLLGSGEREGELRAAAAALGLADRVVFAGFRTDVVSLLPALDVKALASVQETYPVSVLEAMAAARPVVMTDPPGVPDIVVDGVSGFRVPVGDEAALADRLDRLLADPALRQGMGARGYERAAREFPIERTLAGYEELFRRLARRPSSILPATPAAPGG